MRLLTPLLTICFLFAFTLGQAQVEERVENRAKYKTNREIDKTVDKTMDEGFKKVGSIFKKKDKKKKKNKDKNKGDDNSSDGQADGNQDTSDPGDQPEADNDKDSELSNSEIELWTDRYDFVSGDDVLFFDNFNDEELGEFPSRWKYIDGGIETVRTGEKESVMKVFGNTRPRFKEGFSLPDKFTLEFDAYLNEPEQGSYTYYVKFFNEKGYERFQVRVGHGYIHAGNSRANIPDAVAEDFYNKWVHISIAYNKPEGRNGSIKVYFDQYRLINIPDVETIFSDFGFWSCCNSENENKFLIDNVRVAEGGGKMYKREFVDGKIVTHNILFEVDRADLLPRSYAEIQRIVNIMKEQPDVELSIEGHTDSDGSEEYNSQLSLERALAVKKAMVEMGIESNRLTTKGQGETQPVSDNDNSEGKAENRRVEFIKK